MKGKTKIDFEKWFEKRFGISPSKEPNAFGISFYEYKKAMQFGVFEDYYDSCDIEIYIWKHTKG